MILVDDRVGSKEMLPYFKPFGVQVESTRLEFGDVCWAGNGPDGDCMVGLERKTIHDLVNSMRTRRLSGHQLPGLFDTYQFVYLMVEGLFRPGSHGELEWFAGKWKPLYTGNKPIMYREVDAYLATLELKTGMVVRRAGTIQETVVQVVDLYRWWTEKEWAKHTAHTTLYAPPPDVERSGRKVGWRHREPGIVEKVAAQLPGVDEKAWEVGREFGSVREMVEGDRKRWMRVKGIGKTLAERCINQLQGKGGRG